MLSQRIFCRLVAVKLNLALLVAGAVISLFSHSASAAETITFEYGMAAQSVTYEELETFATTGTISPSLKFLFDFSQQHPQTVRWILNQKFPADARVISDLLQTAPGEYLLDCTSSAVHARSDRANAIALRGAFIAAASDDRQITLLELLRHYPTQRVYIDGTVLSQARNDLQNLARETGSRIKLPAAALPDLLKEL